MKQLLRGTIRHDSFFLLWARHADFKRLLKPLKAMGGGGNAQ
jgi:hypothetical protein